MSAAADTVALLARGYLLTQLPAGWLAQRFGAKLVLTLNMAGTAVLFSLLPSAVRAGGAASTLPVAGLLTTMGLCQGGLIPAEAAINREWLAGMEPTARAWMLRVLGFAHQLCHLLATWATPRLASSGRGWPAVCAMYGGSAAVVTVLWQLFAASHPTTSRQPKLEQTQQPKQEKEPEKTVVSSSSLLRFLLVNQPEASSCACCAGVGGVQDGCCDVDHAVRDGLQQPHPHHRDLGPNRARRPLRTVRQPAPEPPLPHEACLPVCSCPACRAAVVTSG